MPTLAWKSRVCSADGLVWVCVGIQEMLERVAKEKGMVWEEFFGKLKSNNQWHVEVY